VEILHGVTAAAPRGGLIGLVGPNGAGKSTLLRAVCGQTPLSGGAVELLGRPLHRLRRRQVAQLACLLPQNAGLPFPFTVREIVAMGRNPHLGRFQPFSDRDQQVVSQAMQQASVDQLAERPVTELSSGEKQRVLLARSLATEAPILLLDEPTTSLDILHQLEVIDLLRRFVSQHKTVLAALHDLNLARQVCSRIVLLSQGRVVAEGSPAETLQASHVERVFGVRVASADDKSLTFALPNAPRP
jgi:iron complex transport system ATP-binding protein